MTAAHTTALPAERLPLALPDTSTRSREGLHVEVVDNTSDFAMLREEWTAWLADSRSDCLFLTWEWLFTWWKHLSSALSILPAALYNDLLTHPAIPRDETPVRSFASHV